MTIITVLLSILLVLVCLLLILLVLVQLPKKEAGAGLAFGGGAADEWIRIAAELAGQRVSLFLAQRPQGFADMPAEDRVGRVQQRDKIRSQRRYFQFGDDIHGQLLLEWTLAV